MMLAPMMAGAFERWLRDDSLPAHVAERGRRRLQQSGSYGSAIGRYYCVWQRPAIFTGSFKTDNARLFLRAPPMVSDGLQPG